MVWVPFAFCISRQSPSRLAADWFCCGTVGWFLRRLRMAALFHIFPPPHFPSSSSSLFLPPPQKGGQLFWILRQFQGSGYRVGRRASKAWRHRRLRLWVGLRLLRRLVGVRCSRTRVRPRFPPFLLSLCSIFLMLLVLTTGWWCVLRISGRSASYFKLKVH